MGKRTITDFIDTGSNSEWKKSLPDLEARIRLIREGSTDLNQGSGIGALNAGEWYFDDPTEVLYLRATDSGNPNSKSMLMFTYFLVFGEWLNQADMNNNSLYSMYSPDKSIYIKYIKAWIIKHGDPTFSDLKLEIHPELNNYPTSKILATSVNTWTDTTLNSFENSVSEVWFKFNDYPAKLGEKYCINMKATGTFSDSSHVAWCKLEPVYTEGLTNDIGLITSGPHRFAIIGKYA